MPKFRPRRTAPAANDRNWTHYTAVNGNNYCIKIRGTSVLPNCVGYAWGRWTEMLGVFHRLSRANANKWWGTNDGYERGQTPKLGSVVCWDEGKYGHVAIVEHIYSDGTIEVSNSDYGGSRFYLRKFKPPYNFGKYKLQGFIHLPKIYNELKTNEEIAQDIWTGRDNWTLYTGAARATRLTQLGYDAQKVQAEIEKIIAANKKPPSKPAPKLKTPAQIANDIWYGTGGVNWGTGATRRTKLTNAGYNYAAVQAEIEKIANKKAAPMRTHAQIAHDIWYKKDHGWGVNPVRANKLKDAGYDPAKVQAEISKIIAILNRK